MPMIEFSLTTFLRHEFHRVVDWYSETPPSLADADEALTIGDCIGRTDIDSRLPDGWRVDRDIVQFSGLAEVVHLTDSDDGYRITLKPVEMAAPTGAIEIYTRTAPSESRQRRDTVDSLSAALAVAERIATTRETQHQPTGRRRQVSPNRGPWRVSTDRRSE